MENINFRGVPTSLFLNGPKLGIVTDPQSISNVSGFATFTGIATATFPDTNFDFDSVSGGSIAFRWYFDGSRILDSSEDSNSNAAIVGFSSATGTGSTITIFGLSANDTGKEIYFEADYIPSAYQTTSPVTAGTARSTGNAFNDPLQSGIGTITVPPIIDITTQPTDQLVSIEDDAIYTIAAQRTPGGGAVNYKWQLNGNDLSDGTTTRSVVEDSTAKVTITGSDGTTDEIDFSKISTYGGFTPGGVTYTLVADQNVNVFLRLRGGGGGGSSPEQMKGSGGSSSGTFTFVKDQQYQLVVGSAGKSSGTAGEPGGGLFGGGGYTGLFEGSITQANAIIIAGGAGGSSGGGIGGDGGGSEGNPGYMREKYVPDREGLGGSQITGGAGADSGGSGSDLQGGTSPVDQSGGGGGGYWGGGSGSGVGDLVQKGTGGGGSGYIGGVTDGATSKSGGFPPVVTVDASGDVIVEGVDGSFEIDLSTNTKTVSTTVTGSNTDTLTINSEEVANGTIKCKVTATDVQESPVFSNTVSYNVVALRDLLEIETYNYADATATLSEFDLSNGDLTIDYASYPGNAVCLYAGDKDLLVEIEMYGGKGEDSGSQSGGEGGYSKIRLTMARDEEYVLAGLFSAVDAPFLYRKASLIACVGAGGDADDNNGGGDGAGIGVRGENGQGSNGGIGGSDVQAGNGDQTARFGSKYDGVDLVGELISPDTQATGTQGGDSATCTRGIYWREQGKSPCEDLGSIKFRTPDGTEISNTATIARGYKSGYNVIQTAGEGDNGGDGGCGYNGGAGGVDGSAGGGGSGYTDGSVTVIDTQLGGSTGASKVIIRRVPSITVTQNITDTKGTMSDGGPFSATRFIDFNSLNPNDPTEGHPIGSITYTVNISGYDNPTFSVTVDDTATRGSGKIDPDNSIAVSEGWPKQLSSNSYEVAFDMINSVGPGRQATAVRSWSVTMTGTESL